jgi:hypothetical protein
MNRTFYISKQRRNSTAATFPVLLAITILCGFGITLDLSPQTRVELIVLAVLFGVATCLYLLSLIEYRLYRLTVRDDWIVERNLIGETRLRLSDVAEVHWKPIRDGSRILLKAIGNRLTLDLTEFEEGDRLRLIRYFRRLINPERQRGWAQFCLDVAVPLRREVEQRDPSPDPDEVMIRRSRVDLYFAPLTGIATLAGWCGWWWLNDWRYFMASVVAAVFWATLRWSILAKGIKYGRLERVPGLPLGIWAFVTGMVVLPLAVILSPDGWWPRIAGLPSGQIAMGAFLLAWFALCHYLLARSQRLQRARKQKQAVHAVKRWEQEEAATEGMEHNGGGT